MSQVTRTTALFLLLAVPLGCSESGTDPGPVPASIQLEAEVETLPVGRTTQLSATVLDPQGDPLPGAEVTFSSSNNSLATVSGTGLVTGVDLGPVTITATAGTVSAEVSLEIVEDPCTLGFVIELGQTVEGTLEEGDCDEILDDGSFFDFWFFELEEETTVAIEMRSPDMDVYLWLTDDDGNLLADDDDSAGGTDALIEINLDAGPYWILANHWPEASGDYTLSLTAVTAGADIAAPTMSVERHTRPRPEAFRGLNRQ